MGKLLHYCIGTLIRPMKTYEELAKDENSSKYSWQLIIFDAFLWVGLMMANYLFGLLPRGERLIIPIPDNIYFLVITILSPVVTMVGIAMAIGFGLMFGRLFKSKSEFNQVFPVYNFALNLPMLLGWVFEFALFVILLITGDKKPHGYQDLVAMAGYIVMIVTTCIYLFLGTMSVLKLNWWKSLIISLLIIAPLGGLIVTYLS